MSSENSDNLLAFVSNLSGINYKRVEEDFGEGFVRLDIAEAERRQAKHDIRTVEDVVTELLRNSRDARAQKIFVAFYKKDAFKRHIVAIDDGCGIPLRVHEKIFEPRVTSKLDSVVFDNFGIHGRGMALYSVRSVVDEAHLVYSEPNRGSIFRVVVDTSKLSERKDQSCFPTVRMRKGKPFAAKGPHNVPRVLVEFSLSYPHIEIFFGSPAQTLATMYWLTSQEGPSEIKSKDADACFKDSSIKLWQCIGAISDASTLSGLARKYYSLEVSERNAWRILGGEVRPLLSVVSLDEEQKYVDQIRMNKIGGESNLTKYIPQEELEILSQVIQENFRDIEKKYFVKIQGEPKVSKFKSQINITITLARDDY